MSLKKEVAEVIITHKSGISAKTNLYDIPQRRKQQGDITLKLFILSSLISSSIPFVCV